MFRQPEDLKYVFAVFKWLSSGLPFIRNCAELVIFLCSKSQQIASPIIPKTSSALALAKPQPQHLLGLIKFLFLFEQPQD